MLGAVFCTCASLCFTSILGLEFKSNSSMTSSVSPLFVKITHNVTLDHFSVHYAKENLTEVYCISPTAEEDELCVYLESKDKIAICRFLSEDDFENDGFKFVFKASFLFRRYNSSSRYSYTCSFGKGSFRKGNNTLNKNWDHLDVKNFTVKNNFVFPSEVSEVFGNCSSTTENGGKVSTIEISVFEYFKRIDSGRNQVRQILDDAFVFHPESDVYGNSSDDSSVFFPPSDVLKYTYRRNVFPQDVDLRVDERRISFKVYRTDSNATEKTSMLDFESRKVRFHVHRSRLFVTSECRFPLRFSFYPGGKSRTEDLKERPARGGETATTTSRERRTTTTTTTPPPTTPTTTTTTTTASLTTATPARRITRSPVVPLEKLRLRARKCFVKNDRSKNYRSRTIRLVLTVTLASIAICLFLVLILFSTLIVYKRYFERR